jgi:hypothetical protein
MTIGRGKGRSITPSGLSADIVTDKGSLHRGKKQCQTN